VAGLWEQRTRLEPVNEGNLKSREKWEDKEVSKELNDEEKSDDKKRRSRRRLIRIKKMYNCRDWTYV